MLTIKDPADLRKYLVERREMAVRQKMSTAGRVHGGVYENGMVYAFDEAIKAVDALIETQEKVEVDTDKKCPVCGRKTAVHEDGSLYEHFTTFLNQDRPGSPTCEGSGLK